jgi:hypothetical protein
MNTYRPYVRALRLPLALFGVSALVCGAAIVEENRAFELPDGEMTASSTVPESAPPAVQKTFVRSDYESVVEKSLFNPERRRILPPPDRKSTRLNSSHNPASRMPSSA